MQQRAIIHVGPHKTGSTFLQQRLLKLKNELMDDGYIIPKDIPGKHTLWKSMANIALSLQSDVEWEYNSTLPYFVKFISEAKENDMGVIISSEEFDMPLVNIKSLMQMLKPMNRTTVVVMYRRVFEWLPSIYFEFFRPKYVENVTFQNVTFPSFVDFLHDQKLSPSWKFYFQPSKVVQRYRKYFNDIFIINFHDERPLDINFFCNAIPHLEKTCNKLQSISTTTKVNKGESLEYRRLLHNAVRYGITNPQVNMAYAETRVKYFHEVIQNKTLYDFPLYCLEDNLIEILFNISLKEEIEMLHTTSKIEPVETALPSFSILEHMEAALRHKFNLFIDSYGFCSIDSTKVLKDKNWVEFFKAL